MLKLRRSVSSFRSLQQFHRSQSINVYSSKWVLPSLKHDIDQFVSSNPPAFPICLLGDPHLRRSNESVLNLKDGFVQATKLRLHLALANFRREHGFGRGISACQIGINLRMIALNLGHGSLTLINPKIVWSSPNTITMWDDCMSIPSLLVKKQRAKSISLVYTDDDGHEQQWNELDVSISELIQHEMDHLEGILNIDKPHVDDTANGRESIISMNEYAKKKNYFDEQVDYTIVPTI